MKLEEFGYALSDATRAIKLDPNYVKAYYRRASCYMQTLRYQSAIADFKKVLALEPKNDQVRTQMAATQKLYRRMEFEKAIEKEDEESAVKRCLDIISHGGCDVEKDYVGPKLQTLEGGKFGITHEFVEGISPLVTNNSLEVSMHSTVSTL
jgi:serine/threonine-protein phosphatase 5